MDAIPIIEITEDDPRWLAMQRQKVEARVRFAHSDQARLELAALLDPSREKPDWTWMPLSSEPPFRVVVWD